MLSAKKPRMARDYAEFGAFFFCFSLFCTCGNLCACVGIERCNTPEMLALEAEVKLRYGEILEKYKVLRAEQDQ